MAMEKILTPKHDLIIVKESIVLELIILPFSDQIDSLFIPTVSFSCGG